MLTNGRTPTSDVLNRPRVLSDLHMMVQLNAQERDIAHMTSLLQSAGFRFKGFTQVCPESLSFESDMATLKGCIYLLIAV